MLAITLAAFLFFFNPPQVLKVTPQQLAQDRVRLEQERQAAIRLNAMAANIHSEADAEKFVDAIAAELSGRQGKIQSWATRAMRHRVARAEFAAVSDPSNLIPEQRIVDVWNEYMREIGAPEETLVTVAEVHNLRDGMYTGSQRMWSRGGFAQSIWMAPNVYALGADGKVAEGCRAVEALKILHDMEDTFLSVQSARERVQKGVLVSEWIKHPQPEAAPPPKAVLRVSQGLPLDEISSCARRYARDHGQKTYRQMMERLFRELLPS